MDGSYSVPHPTDWLDTPVAQIGPVESALRCQVCKDFFNTPMITSCSHTFCSLCIRKCLTDDGVCPTCRCADQMMRLRQNWAVQEIVESFQIARPSILLLSESIKAGEAAGATFTRKRRLEVLDAEDDDCYENRRPKRPTTRSQNISGSASPTMGVKILGTSDASYQPSKHRADF